VSAVSISDTETSASAFTPTGLASQIRRHLLQLGEGRVEGEVRDLSRSGRHCYFAIADEESSIRCVVWGSVWERLEHQPSEGDQIEAHFTKIDFWAPKGSLSIHIDAVELAGEGRFLARQAEVLARLVADGLCDPGRKRPLPRFPRKVGLVAAAAGEARVDVIAALTERFPPVQIVFCPAVVQGTSCVGSVIDALATLDAHPEVDVIVLARGGGSASDLYPFSDERLCRTIAALRTPVVTSIGHTRQAPNCDHVSAASAHVPAAAAALVVPAAADLQARLANATELFDRAARKVGEHRARVDTLARLLAQRDPPAQARLRLDALHGRLAALEAELPHRRRLTERHACLERAAAELAHQLRGRSATLPGKRSCSTGRRLHVCPAHATV
jgi:exodeoxyribonuclease VII large subunit